MTSSRKKRIAIIGMGYAGLALCFHLLKQGAGEITLFDRHPQGNGASQVSAGLLHLYPGVDARLVPEGIARLRAAQELLDLAGQAKGHPIFSQKGLIRLAMSPNQRAVFAERARQHSDITFLEEAEMAQRLPHLPPRAALWIPHAMVVDAQGYLEGLRRVCLQEGACFVQQEVMWIGQEGREYGKCGKHGTPLGQGFNLPGAFDEVVIAMGSGACICSELAPFRLRAIKGQVLELIWPKDVPPLDCPITGDCYLIPLCQEDQKGQEGQEGRQEGRQERRCLVGGTFEKEFTSPLPDLACAEAYLRPRLEAIAPQFAGAQCVNVRAGVRLTTPQHTPIAQKIASGLWALTALGSKGLLHHALLAERLARALVVD